MNPAETTGLIQYGAIGILAIVAVTFAYRLWSRLEKSYQEETARGDRLEAELIALNKSVIENLARATEVLRQLIDIEKAKRPPPPSDIERQD